MTLVDIINSIEQRVDRLLGVYNNSGAPPSNAMFDDLAQKYKLAIVCDAESNDLEIAFKHPDERQKHICIDLLQSELNLYHPDIIKRSKLEQIVLCSRLHANGKHVAGLAQMGWFVIDTLFLDVDGISRGWEYARKSFHHEMFHAIDYHDDLNRYIDLDWAHLNASHFNYSTEGYPGYNQPSKELGFLSTYSTTSVHEDKAELYCHMIVNYMLVRERMGADPVLTRKVERMKELLERFSPHFDQIFWQMIEERSVSLNVRNPDKKSNWDQALGSHPIGQNNDETTVCKVKLWTTKKGSRTLWNIGLIDAEGSHPDLFLTFFTVNKLRGCLHKLGIVNFNQNDLTKEGLELIAHANRQTLRELGLLAGQ
jgi:hypothetical protein